MSLWTDFPGLRFHWPTINAIATRYELDPLLVSAIILKESSANCDAFRHERDFWNRYLKRLPEWTLLNPRRVSSSYGLMQVMFPVAVERGYPKDQPPEGLFVPETGVDYGCKQLRYLMARMASKYPGAPADSALRAVIASYNGGFQGPDALRPLNRSYADAVLKLYQRLKTEQHA